MPPMQKRPDRFGVQAPLRFPCLHTDVNVYVLLPAIRICRKKRHLGAKTRLTGHKRREFLRSTRLYGCSGQADTRSGDSGNIGSTRRHADSR